MTSPQNKGRKYGKKLAADWGHKENVGSGNHWAAKGDTPTKKFLTETKWTDSDKYVFTIEDWETHENHAMKQQREPVFIIGFQGGVEVAVLGYWFFDILRDEIKKTRSIGFTGAELNPRGKVSFGLKESDMRTIKFHSRICNLTTFELGSYKFVVVTRKEFEIWRELYGDS